MANERLYPTCRIMWKSCPPYPQERRACRQKTRRRNRRSLAQRPRDPEHEDRLAKWVIDSLDVASTLVEETEMGTSRTSSHICWVPARRASFKCFTRVNSVIPHDNPMC